MITPVLTRIGNIQTAIGFLIVLLLLRQFAKRSSMPAQGV